MSKYIMALDAGTTSNRCILYNVKGEVCALSQKEFTQFYPQPGWVEHDPMEIFAGICEVMKEALASVGAKASDVAAIGISSQRETTVVWDRTTGKPIFPAIVWQCRRTASICDDLIEKGRQDYYHRTTGLLIDAYFSATKLHWILKTVKGARVRAEAGELLFGTIDSWLIWKLSGGEAHVTDYSNASRTMLFDIHKLRWDPAILVELDIPVHMLPEVVDCSYPFATTTAEILGSPVPITGVAGDQQAALFGQACYHKGMVKNTYGTGCFLLMNTGSEPVKSTNGLLTTIAWGLDGQISYALEGSVFIAGAAIQWLRDELGLIKSASETEFLANQVPDTAGCYVVPAFSGLGAPYWDQYARGAILGLSRGVNRCHIIRATLESLAYQTDDVIEAMERDVQVKVSELMVDGGASANNFLLQFQADITDTHVLRPTSVESSAKGAAYLAGLQVGFWKDIDDLPESSTKQGHFYPKITKQERQTLRSGWKKAVARTQQWETTDA